MDSEISYKDYIHFCFKDNNIYYKNKIVSGRYDSLVFSISKGFKTVSIHAYRGDIRVSLHWNDDRSRLIENTN